jgi:predicted NBD/HSP70 family sugar kinase
MTEVTAGIDIGGIDTEIGLVSKQGKFYKKATILTPNFPDVNEFVRECFHVITKSAKDLK